MIDILVGLSLQAEVALDSRGPKNYAKKRLDLGRFRGAGVTGGYFGISEVFFQSP